MLVTTERMGESFRKRAVALVGLGDQILRLAEARVGAHGVDASADDDGGIEAAGGEHRGHHRSGGGLAVHAGDGDAVLQAHQLGQHLGALDDRDVRAVRFGDLGIVRGNRGTGDDDFGAGDIFGAMAFEHGCAQAGQPLGDGGALQVGAGDLVAEIQQHLGDAAHADAADAYEMDALNLGEHKSTSWPRISRIHTDNRKSRTVNYPMC